MPADAKFAWLSDERLQSVFTVLLREGEARLVGGCVRDTLLGLTPLSRDGIDIDIATTLTPDEMSGAFSRAGMRWVATGAAHGTITAIVDGLVCECTSLRSDIETDGRHASVAFTKDWNLDWQRRDFTINALYADREGNLWDPAGGLKDLEAQRVRFIGEPKERIREDALRIMRFFRFSARFGEAFDQDAMRAIGEDAALLDHLSKERIWSELSRTLSTKCAPAAMKAAEEVGVLRRIVDAPTDHAAFESVHSTTDLPVALGVAALWPGLAEDTLREAFKPPTDFLKSYRGLEATFVRVKAGASAPRLLYEFGRDIAADGVRLAKARGVSIAADLVQAVKGGDIPVLPIAGRDLIAAGLPPGEQIGEILRHFEEAWLRAGAPHDDQSVSTLLAGVLSSQASS